MAGTDTFVQLPPDSTGKKIRSWSNTVGPDTVHAQAFVPTSQDADILANASGIFAQDAVAGTPSQSSVGASADVVTLLNSNAARLGATVFNDSAVVMYLKLGTAASTSSYTVKLVEDAYFEVPYRYTGAITALWASATGNARITELAA